MEGTRSLVRICFSCSDEHRGKNGIDGIAAGGARRDRTDDLLLAKQALSQLSYGPTSFCKELVYRAEAAKQRRLVGPGRLELPTSRLSGVRSNHLSYGPFLDTPETPTARSGLRTLTREYVACEERETKAAKFRMFRAV